MDFFDSLNELLDKKAAEGERGGARMGQGAAASGQGQLWAEWPRMRPEQRAKLLEEMLKVGAWGLGVRARLGVSTGDRCWG